MARRYVYTPATSVVYGRGATSELIQELRSSGCERVLLITTRSVHQTEYFQHVTDLLEDGGLLVGTHVGCRQHLPEDAAVDVMLEAFTLRPDAIVTVGGGSVTEAGKVAAASVAMGATKLEDLDPILGIEPGGGSGLGSADELAMQVCIPTTLSAGEYSGGFGVTVDKTKRGYGDLRLTPRTVILDPNATVGTPGWLLASTGIRAVDHAVESFISQTPTPPTDATSVEAARRLFRSLVLGTTEQTLENRVLGARLDCQIGGWLSMFGFHNAGVGISHAIGHQLGGRFGIPHGITSCIILPLVIPLLAERAPERTGQFARRTGLAEWNATDEQAGRMLELELTGLVARLNVPQSLAHYNLSHSDIEDVVLSVMARNTTSHMAAIPVSDNDVRDILQMALQS